jgi:hypothetical protein
MRLMHNAGSVNKNSPSPITGSSGINKKTSLVAESVLRPKQLNRNTIMDTKKIASFYFLNVEKHQSGD